MLLRAQRQCQEASESAGSPDAATERPRSDAIFVLPSGKLDAMAQFCMEWKGLFIMELATLTQLVFDLISGESAHCQSERGVLQHTIVLSRLYRLLRLSAMAPETRFCCIRHIGLC